MKLIVLGDIHGNLRALRRALQEAEQEGYDRIVHTGDLAGFGPHVDEVVDLLASRGIEGVRGNLDAALADGEEEPRAPLIDEVTTRQAAATLRRTSMRLSPGAIRHIGNLPFEIRLPTPTGEAALYHANPFDLSTYYQAGVPEEGLAVCIEAARAAVVVTGHAHTGFHRDLIGGHFIGAASVGFPRDGDPRGGYTVVRFGPTIRVEHRRFAYDVEEAAREALAMGMPEDVAQRWLRGK